jgi:hypothetical protein
MFKYPTIASLGQYLTQEHSEETGFEEVSKRAEKQRAVIDRQRRMNTHRRGINE